MPPNSALSGPSLKSALSNKRKEPGPNDNASKKFGGRDGGRPPKRVKIRSDREIATQDPSLALKNGELDLQAFLNAREFEIRALEESMRHIKAESSTRAFQQVPRGMRRRTASHNAKRVPKRLRRRAIKEMNEDNTPTVVRRRRKPKTARARIRAETAKRLGILAEKKRKRKLKAAREKAATTSGSTPTEPSATTVTTVTTVTTRPPRPKIRRNQLNEPPKPKSKFRKRQAHKTWLPTHLWHAKRARMTDPKNPLWRFAIPLTPNEKVYRPTHRAQGEKGTIVWDTSYMSTIGLYGNNEKGVEQLLRRLGVTQESCWDERGRRWRAGTRHWTGFLSRETKLGRRFICPATIIWNPASAEEPQQQQQNDQQPPGPENDQAAEPERSQTKTAQRQLFFRVHPSAFLELFDELLRLAKMQNPRLYIEDLRFEIGSIEITGPASTETLLGILHPYYTKPDLKEKHADVFASLTSLTNPASTPPNSLLAFSIMDPRLRYPPRRAPTDSDDEKAQNKLLDTLAKWPADEHVRLRPHALFDRNVRFNATKLPSQKSIDRRKGAKLPGTDLEPSVADPPLPIILLASRPGNVAAQAQGTWTLLAPFKCIQPLWYSLVHFPLSSGGNPRFGGLNEARQVPFERGQPSFPFDFLGTDAGAQWEAEERARRKRDWERRPKSKRTAWDALDLGAGRKGEIGDGWACHLEHIFRLEEGARDSAQLSPDRMDIDGAPPAGEKDAKAEAPPPAADSLKLIQRLSKESFKELISSKTSPPPPPPDNSIITVSITLTSRGVANPCARIYRLPSRPAPQPPSSSAEVPASAPPPQSPSKKSRLPPDLRDQWLARLPPSSSARLALKGSKSKPHSNTTPSTTTTTSSSRRRRRFPPDADMQTRKRILAASLLAAAATPPPAPYPPPRPNQTDMGGHPLVPDEDDLIGFVTTGAFTLSEGKGTAVGSIAVHKAVEALQEARRGGGGAGRDDSEGRLCIVRNAGENVGWLARWEVV
ncbi:hypothetical protein SODALDRAFT_329628 [Sodiomyces alkalinus F11]|uniref:POPLD-domain-containing protein n=1 Tax=Sodiomyces alkalinus (strain CBS 110278 / VKM F-3762 / F11) TaxID=1314773 RepID=A0A3N2PKB2_SODAK|nr:hypothetical protein SODALDRAFT_329628 [Sodiomyces alkalinus F11]ROT34756.1 hypothetical protein SODALDRAFT_329628 [Sodiomyces alkalinus F11]